MWWVELATKCSYCSLSIFKFFHSWNKAVWEMVNTINYHNELPLQHTLPCIPTQPWQRDWGTIATSLLQYCCNPSGPSGSWRQAFQRRAKHVYHYTSPMLILLTQGNVRMMGPVIFTMWFKSQRYIASTFKLTWITLLRDAQKFGTVFPKVVFVSNLLSASRKSLKS